jgi:hypothetical protein
VGALPRPRRSGRLPSLPHTMHPSATVTFGLGTERIFERLDERQLSIAERRWRVHG